MRRTFHVHGLGDRFQPARTRQAEIGDFERVLVHEYIFRLKIAVHNAVVVQRYHTRKDRQKVPFHPGYEKIRLRLESFLRHGVSKRPPWNVFHGDVFYGCLFPKLSVSNFDEELFLIVFREIACNEAV